VTHPVWVRFPNERNQGKQAHPVLKYRVPHGSHGMPSQRNQSESFRFKRAAFYQGLKSKVGLAAAKAAALRINLNVQGCSIVAAPMHAPSRTSLLLPLLLSHNLPLPRVHIVRDGQTSLHRPRLVVSRSTCPPISPPPPCKQLCTRASRSTCATRDDEPRPVWTSLPITH
jgi:hypothetical protein